eukprot:6452363-Amphidinium_carterae.1
MDRNSHERKNERTMGYNGNTQNLGISKEASYGFQERGESFQWGSLQRGTSLHCWMPAVIEFPQERTDVRIV